MANEKSDSYEISFLSEDYANNKNKNKNKKGSNYYRQIKLIDVSGTVSEGGLAGMNTHHCN